LTLRRTGGFHCSTQRMTVMWIWECQCSRHPCCLHCPHHPCCHHHPYHHHYVLVHDHKPQIPEQIQALGGENTGIEEAMEAGREVQAGGEGMEEAGREGMEEAERERRVETGGIQAAGGEGVVEAG